MLASFTIVRETSEYIYIVDNSNVAGSKTITNDAEEVISYLFNVGFLSCSQRVYYKDTNGCIDELLHFDGRFKGFKSGHGMYG
jgi:hypothetical protein